MAANIWLNARFADETLRAGRDFYTQARRHGADINLALTFTGYALERRRQDGRGAVAWARVERTRHRYARGKNGVNYRRLGCRVLAIDMSVRLVPGTPLAHDARLVAGLAAMADTGQWQELHDYLEEMGYDGLLAVLDPPGSRPA